MFIQSDGFSWDRPEKARWKSTGLSSPSSGRLPASAPRWLRRAAQGSLSVSPLSSPRSGLSSPCALDDAQSPCPITVPPQPQHPARARHAGGVRVLAGWMTGIRKFLGLEREQREGGGFVCIQSMSHRGAESWELMIPKRDEANKGTSYKKEGRPRLGGQFLPEQQEEGLGMVTGGCVQESDRGCVSGGAGQPCRCQPRGPAPYLGGLRRL